ncbi:hypothetical protein BESB_031210 [Besnoitia besnoiti]|uniref:Uncharacterized protein n=1 Tax=Besnoitia besnoiti TaxID=94643 RepID=A0A2A9M6I7_BESBE|nr:hypothetical protein BESB_031210 [Besnoitia besnoiti]PFH31247.1 hypothetical protein BESB_031210 [Besnoitia besnoiti]
MSGDSGMDSVKRSQVPRPGRCRGGPPAVCCAADEPRDAPANASSPAALDLKRRRFFGSGRDAPPTDGTRTLSPHVGALCFRSSGVASAGELSRRRSSVLDLPLTQRSPCVAEPGSEGRAARGRLSPPQATAAGAGASGASPRSDFQRGGGHCGQPLLRRLLSTVLAVSLCFQRFLVSSVPQAPAVPAAPASRPQRVLATHQASPFSFLGAAAWSLSSDSCNDVFLDLADGLNRKNQTITVRLRRGRTLNIASFDRSRYDMMPLNFKQEAYQVRSKRPMICVTSELIRLSGYFVFSAPLTDFWTIQTPPGATFPTYTFSWPTGGQQVTRSGGLCVLISDSKNPGTLLTIIIRPSAGPTAAKPACALLVAAVLLSVGKVLW